ncbi:hypothetical protein ACEZCY_04245 [Streptacidiphilus sp. N1-12]|uniref:Uncharacterized protein n=2 Tax=Streptacidiphilus alkalitolerans TaxID=3342712 RepID=A0ABV6W8V2_9ACTN
MIPVALTELRKDHVTGQTNLSIMRGIAKLAPPGEKDECASMAALYMMHLETDF